MDTIMIDGNNVKITNPEKLLWPELGIRKIDYIIKLIELSAYILPHSSDRLLTAIRYPDGVHGKSFYQKNIPNYAPNWVNNFEWRSTNYIVLDSKSTLAWLGNQAALEFHIAFNSYHYSDFPTYFVFDLDPSEGQVFDQVVEAALLIHETLESLKIKSFVKTSGATGLQVYIPAGNKYDYETARRINQFFGEYFSQKYPEKITIERKVNKRGKKLYFDYLQMWHGKTITMVYSPRATAYATVSMPITWDELKKGIKPEDFTLLNIKERLESKGDIFLPTINSEINHSLDQLVGLISKK